MHPFSRKRTTMLFLSLALSFLSFEVFGLELTESNVCDVCQCGPGPGMNPREKAVCHDFVDGTPLKVSSLPNFVTSLSLRNVVGGVILSRGSVRIPAEGENTFRLNVSKTPHLELSEKSLTLLGPASTLQITLEEIENVNISSKAVSAQKPGRLILRAVACGTVTIDSRCCDALSDLHLSRISTLRLSSAALKPNVQHEDPETRVTFVKVGSIPIIPTETFASAASISIIDCKIGEIESAAFSGISVNSVTFERTSFDRIHSRSFPEKSLLTRLLFVNCTLTSVADKAISSAITSLEIHNSDLSSISREAISSHVAKVELLGNTFQTMTQRSFVFRAWSELYFVNNRINFMESGCLAGIEAPDTEVTSNVTFVFKDNHIHYANKDALTVTIPSSVHIVVDNNVFYKYCECGMEEWLKVVCGAGTTNSSFVDLDSHLIKSSHCQVPELSRPCFREALVKMSAYTQMFCDTGTVAENNEEAENIPSCMLTNQISIWDIVNQHLEVSTTRGILLIVLVFALSCSLVVAFVTFLRWICYTVSSKSKYKSQEWNFTKIEEKKFDQRDSSMHECQPLTGESNLDTSGNSGETRDDLPISVSVESDEEDDGHNDNVNKICKATETTHTTLETEAARRRTSPKPTFYDEMICLLQEKLDDPSNYATVADLQTTCFYQDPHDKLDQK